MFRANGILRTSGPADGSATWHTRAPRSGTAVSVVAILALIVCGGCSGGAVDPSHDLGLGDARATTCTWQGQVFPVGGYGAEGCTFCTCATGGVLTCSAAGVSAGCACEYGGQTYQPGEVYSPDNGCNTCTCDGSPHNVTAHCTHNTCPEGGPPFDAGDASSDGGTNTCPPCDADAGDCDGAACGD